jgi:anti-sigma factor RsiW
MTADPCRAWRERIGALVLGQLPGDEAAATRAHLEGCNACRREAELLAPLADLLARADPVQIFEEPAPPPDLAPRITRRIAAERRQRRRRRFRIAVPATAVAAAAAAVIAILVVGAGGAPKGPEPVRVAFDALPNGAEAAVALSPDPSGSRVDVGVSGVPDGTLCRVWIRRADGEREPAGSFRYREGTGASETTALASAVSPTRARAVGLQIGRRTFVGQVPGAVSS